jgi:hypothetical protein
MNKNNADPPHIAESDEVYGEELLLRNTFLNGDLERMEGEAQRTGDTAVLNSRNQKNSKARRAVVPGSANGPRVQLSDASADDQLRLEGTSRTNKSNNDDCKLQDGNNPEESVGLGADTHRLTENEGEVVDGSTKKQIMTDASKEAGGLEEPEGSKEGRSHSHSSRANNRRRRKKKKKNGYYNTHNNELRARTLKHVNTPRHQYCFSSINFSEELAEERQRLIACRGHEE